MQCLLRPRSHRWSRRWLSSWRVAKTRVALPSAPGFTVEYATHPIANANPQAPPLVAIHCSGSSYRQWDALAEALAATPHVASQIVAPNLFATGAATRRARRRCRRRRRQRRASPCALADAGVSDEAPHVVGHSHGGGVALRFAATRGVASVVVVEPNHFFLLEAAPPIAGDAALEDLRRAGVKDCAAFCESMLASSMTRFRNWGPLFHDFWLRQGDEAFDDLPADARDRLVGTTVPHTAHEIHSVYAARGRGAARDLGALAAEGAKHLVLSPEPGRGSRGCLRALDAVLRPMGFRTSALPAGGHLAPLTHAAETASHLVACLDAPPPPESEGPAPPNIVLLMADDMGWGDLASYGHPTQEVGHIDKLAAGGLRFRQWYAAESVCTPSRAAALTGRLPARTGMIPPPGAGDRVLAPDDAAGVPAEEVLLSEALVGWRTGFVGKWHLGINARDRTDGAHLPTARGFGFAGLSIPFSNHWACDESGANVAAPDASKCFLYRGAALAQQPIDHSNLTNAMVADAVGFVEQGGAAPFFLYFALPQCHVSLFNDARWAGSSRNGRYGATLREMDWAVGAVVEALEPVRRETLVIFTSDHGPHVELCLEGGLAGPLRGGKATRAGRAACACRASLFHYCSGKLVAARRGDYKLKFWLEALPPETWYADRCDVGVPRGDVFEGWSCDDGVDWLPAPLLFHVPSDPAERYALAWADDAILGAVVDAILGAVAAHNASLAADRRAPRLGVRVDGALQPCGRPLAGGGCGHFNYPDVVAVS
ncbi:steryl-sulfatase [Aureococcus anophagefferens]|uniref:Steryl-sulfatase n=1 Tax=Aureococcus anophagefferens TaxID=44056 RepID=A0ABR1G232_AURAN